MYALDNLRVFKCDRRQVISERDARYFFIFSTVLVYYLFIFFSNWKIYGLLFSVALSCTVNLSCDGLHDYFEEEFLIRAASAYNLPTPENRTGIVLDPLQKLLPGHDVRFVLEKVRILKGRYQEQQRAGETVPKHWEAILDIVERV